MSLIRFFCRMCPRTALCILIIPFSCGNAPRTDSIPLVKDVDIKRYSGIWYEIARLPHSFEKGLICVTATYSVEKNGSITVVNQGISENDRSKRSVARATAVIPDANQPGLLEVTFFWPFSGDYRIIELDQEYRHAMVTSKTMDYLWILSRTPQMDESIYRKLVDDARRMGFDLSAFSRVPQDCWK